jgi:hypothetical protein
VCANPPCPSLPQAKGASTASLTSTLGWLGLASRGKGEGSKVGAANTTTAVRFEDTASGDSDEKSPDSDSGPAPSLGALVSTLGKSMRSMMTMEMEVVQDLNRDEALKVFQTFDGGATQLSTPVGWEAPALKGVTCCMRHARRQWTGAVRSTSTS